MPRDEASKKIEDVIQQINDLDEPGEDLLNTLEEFRSIDIADVFHHIKRSLRITVFNHFTDEAAAEVLVELDDILIIELLRELSSEKAALILNLLPPDEGADVIALSEEEDQPHILTHVEEGLANQIRSLSSYAPESAGGLMTSGFLAVQGDESVRSVLIKVKTSEQAETVNYIYVTDESDKLVGVASVRGLLQAKLNQGIHSILEHDVISVPLEMDQEEVTRTANKYHLHTIPVLDDEGVLKGIITFDDMMEVLEEESSEDIYRMAGEHTLHPTQQPVWRRVLARFPWLLVTLGGTLLAAGLIKVFETVFSDDAGMESMESLGDLITVTFSSIDNTWTFLLCFLPMIGGMAGNVGLQSSTVIVRGLATGEVEQSFLSKILYKEMVIAACIGLMSGLIIGSEVMIIFQSQEQIGFIIGLSLFSAIISAAFLGTMMPFLCLFMRVDPAYAAGPLLTTLNDIIGFMIFFGIAYAMLSSQ